MIIGRVRNVTKNWLKASLPVHQQVRLKRAFVLAREPIRFGQRRRKPPMPKRRLVTDLRRGDVEAGDALLVHSSLSAIGNVEGGAATIIESLIEAVGPEGTVLMPTFRHDEIVLREAARGGTIDLRTSQSETGTITEVLRTWPGVLRSSHPFSSFCAWGKHADFLTSGHGASAEIAHAQSPMARLLELGGKFMGIGVSLGAASFVHVIEDTWDGFPIHVYLPPEEISYVDAHGAVVTRLIHRYDPNVARTRLNQPSNEWVRKRLTDHFQRKGILRFFQYGEAQCWIAQCRSFYDELKRLADKGVTIYLTQSEWEARDDSHEPW